jgi:methyl-accepting chemotaxis protein
MGYGFLFLYNTGKISNLGISLLSPEEFMKFQLKLKSIQWKIILWTGMCMLVAVASIEAFSVMRLREMSVQTAQNQAIAEAKSAAGSINSQIEVALDAARTLSHVFMSVKSGGMALTREQANAILMQVLEENPQFLGISTCWEPDAFDDLDIRYTNTRGHDDTGRFIPYWVRSGDQIKVIPLVGYETEGAGDYYLIPKATKQETILDPFLYPIDGKDVLMTSLMVPIVVNEKFYGVVGVDLRLDFLQTLADSSTIFNGAGKLALVSYKGSLAGVTGAPELMGKSLSAIQDDWEEDLGIIQAGKETVQNDEGSVDVYEPIIFGKTSTPWAVNVIIPLSAITAQATQLMWQMIAIGFLLVIIALALIWFASRQIARPITQVTLAAQSLARGNLEHNLDLHQQDETGRLANAFAELVQALVQKTEIAERIADGDLTVEALVSSVEDRLGLAMKRMVSSLRDQVSHIAESALNLTLASKQLSNAANEAEQTTSQISDTIQEIAKGAGQQSVSTSQTAGTAEQMAQSITGVAQGAQEQAEAVSQVTKITIQLNTAIQMVTDSAQASARGSLDAAQVARGGTETVEETMRRMGEIKGKVSQSTQKVREMGKRSEQIGTILEVIEDIASQTNLLALNAAIEAARAGEHGKGFAVVADEVRKLAERAASSTKEIGILVKGIQKIVTEAVKAMDDSSAEVELGVKNANEAGGALVEITGAVEAVNHQANLALEAAQEMKLLSDELIKSTEMVSAVVEENSASAEEMKVSANEVTGAIENIASISEENSASIEEVSASTEEMSAQVEEVTASAQSLAELAEDLKQVVAHFKLA